MSRGGVVIASVCGVAVLVAFTVIGVKLGERDTPQFCRDLKPAIDDYKATRATYTSLSPRNGKPGPATREITGWTHLPSHGLYVEAQKELARTALAVSQTPSAREWVIGENLALLSDVLASFDEEKAVSIAGEAIQDIEEQCRFSIFGYELD